MSKGNVNRHLEASREAIDTFLTALLGEHQSVQLSVEQASVLSNTIGSESEVLLVAAHEGDALRCVLSMPPQWLSTFSQAMLGSVLNPGDEGADDLLRELAGQAYGAIRSRLASDEVKLPEITFSTTSASNLEEIHGTATTIRLELATETGALVAEAHIIGTTGDESVTPAPNLHQAQESMPRVDISPAAFPELGTTSVPAGDGGNFELLAEVELEVTVELGRRRIALADVLRLTTGSVIELEKLVGEPLEVYANGRLIAEGEAVVIDEQFGVRITNLVSSGKRAKAFI